MNTMLILPPKQVSFKICDISGRCLWLNTPYALNDSVKSENSIEYFYKAIRIKPNFAEAFHSLGTANERLGNKQESLKNYQEALKIKPDYAEVFDSMGTVLSDLARYDESIKSGRRCVIFLTSDPGYVSSNNNNESFFDAAKTPLSIFVSSSLSSSPVILPNYVITSAGDIGVLANYMLSSSCMSHIEIYL